MSDGLEKLAQMDQIIAKLRQEQKVTPEQLQKVIAQRDGFAANLNSGPKANTSTISTSSNNNAATTTTTTTTKRPQSKLLLKNPNKRSRTLLATANNKLSNSKKTALSTSKTTTATKKTTIDAINAMTSNGGPIVQILDTPQTADEMAIQQPPPLTSLNTNASNTNYSNRSSLNQSYSHSTRSHTHSQSNSKSNSNSVSVSPNSRKQRHHSYTSYTSYKTNENEMNNQMKTSVKKLNFKSNVNELIETRLKEAKESIYWETNYLSKANGVIMYERYFKDSKHKSFQQQKEFPWMYKSEIEKKTHVRDYLNPCLKLLNRIMSMDEALHFIDPLCFCFLFKLVLIWFACDLAVSF